ncbi:hypothetical protein WAA37_006300 [Pseudomonas aeruginosa]|nr:hypothetical protein [Pseudomonas aeruginosa]HBO4519179.1 hypothetical protein [Pseudomonas aeruginosa]HBP5920690.1 hypothetical protein [Pseudomonas aeruginosa]HBP5953973.1 hypothetical protein [Pseudomonas aeruginosa]HBP6057379.1 hypothetical protein [Pseudomonas aeruginosa]
MKLYQIAYDLRKQRNYQALYDRIKAYGTWCRPLESTWIVATSQSATQVRDNLQAAMDADDGLLVTRLQGDAAWHGLAPEQAKWLQNQYQRCEV